MRNNLKSQRFQHQIFKPEFLDERKGSFVELELLMVGFVGDLQSSGAKIVY